MDYLVAAGIIPYIQINDTTFYLLGKEKYNNYWSGFIGNSKNDDISITNTAIREFNEETCNLYIDYLPTIINIVHKTTPVITTNKNKNKNIYIYFIKFPSYFFNNNTTYKFKNNLKLYKNNKDYTEKSLLGWFPTTSLLYHQKVLPSLKNIIKQKCVVNNSI